jgi:histidyl-tRNA synthetase
VLRGLDKLSKLGATVVRAELIDKVGLPAAVTDEILALAQASQTGLTSGDSAPLLELAQQAVGDHPLGCQGVAELRELLQSAYAAGVPRDRLVVDISIARGLDYYTGTIVETSLLDLPEIGSVCSGGVMTTWRDSIPNRTCPASVPRWDWTDYWPRWTNWA